MPFSVTTRGLSFTEKVASVTVLPGADLDLDIAGDDGPYRVEAKDGTVSSAAGGDVAMAGAGRARPRHAHRRRTRAARKALELHVFVHGAVRRGP